MAASPTVPTVPNTPILNRQGNGGYARERPPSGPCNYTNLNIGGSAKCGCRRFTDNGLDVQGAGSPPGICVCAHHSCYHDLVADGESPVVDVPMADVPLLAPKPSTPVPSRAEDGNPEAGQVQMDSLPDTLEWSRFINSGASQGSILAIPSQCLLPSDNGSRASSSQAAHARPFAGLGLQTLSHIRKTTPTGNHSLATGKDHLVYENGNAMQIYHDSHGQRQFQSLTEVATPSVRSFQDVDAEAAFAENGSIVQNALQKLADERAKGLTIALKPPSEDASTGPESATMLNDTDDGNLLPRIMGIVKHVIDHPLKIENHEHRLDQLENASFSQPLLDEIRDGHDHLENLVTELDERVTEVERQQQALNDTSSVGSRPPVNTSIDSRISTTSSALVAQAIDRVDYARIEALQSQISELQNAAPPSYFRPWEVEVVFLPFGPQLMGVWSSKVSASEAAKISMMSDDNWTHTQNNSIAAAQANVTAHDRATAWEPSPTDISDPQSWLMPRACGTQSRVDSRLRSRGLVKMIQIKGPDARDVQAAMLSAFGELLQTVAQDSYSRHARKSTIPQSLSHFLGLRSSWVPLRKVHKDSCLRFLNTSEMVTPALWTAQFISSSVAMRSTGIRRLYVTQPDSYVQHLGTTTAWTWQKLRQLDRVYPNLSFDHTAEADAHEPCWEFDERLDPSPSVHSSIESHLSLTIRPVSHDKPDPASASYSSSPLSRAASITPTSPPAPPGNSSPPLKERHPLRHIHTRTASMPSLVPLGSPSLPKRRIASFDNDTQSSPMRPQTLKRLRTRSPSHPRDTPRWSVGPPSPYPYVEEFAEMKRGATPFAYATPHSNAPYIERRISGEFEDDGDDEPGSTTEEFEGGEHNALSDYDSYDSEKQSHQREDEWEGVQDLSELPESESRMIGMRINGSLRPAEEHSEDEGSSCPSEYPSHQPRGLVSGDTKAGFRIHVDEEAEFPE